MYSSFELPWLFTSIFLSLIIGTTTYCEIGHRIKLCVSIHTPGTSVAQRVDDPRT